MYTRASPQTGTHARVHLSKEASTQASIPVCTCMCARFYACIDALTYVLHIVFVVSKRTYACTQARTHVGASTHRRPHFAHMHAESHAIADRRMCNPMRAHEHMQTSVRRCTHTGKHRRMCARAHPHTNASAHVRWIEVAHKSMLIRWIHTYVSSARVNAHAHARGRATQANQQTSNKNTHTKTRPDMNACKSVRALAFFHTPMLSGMYVHAQRVCVLPSCILVDIVCF